MPTKVEAQPTGSFTKRINTMNYQNNYLSRYKNKTAKKKVFKVQFI